MDVRNENPPNLNKENKVSQSFINTWFHGAREEKSARKIIKFMTYYGFITVTFAIVITFMPYQPFQDLMDQSFSEKMIFLVSYFVSITCLVFLMKEKFWAACLLLALPVVEMILTYFVKNQLPSAFSIINAVFYLQAVKAIYFLQVQKRLKTRTE
jgi:hypothetical protein